MITLTYILYVFKIGNEIGTMISFIIFDFILMLSEFLTCSYNKSIYLNKNSIFNWLDIIIIFTLFLLVVFDYVLNDDKFMMNFHFFGVFFISLRLFLELRIFSAFRHLT